MQPDETLHDKLLAELRLYFEANQIWATQPSRKAAIAVRRHLINIRKICNDQYHVIQKWRYVVYPARTTSKHVKEKYQDQSDNDTNEDN